LYPHPCLWAPISIAILDVGGSYWVVDWAFLLLPVAMAVPYINVYIFFPPEMSWLKHPVFGEKIRN